MFSCLLISQAAQYRCCPTNQGSKSRGQTNRMLTNYSSTIIVAVVVVHVAVVIVVVDPTNLPLKFC